jgi:hypothetical protein
MKHMADCLDIKINEISLFPDLFTNRILVLKGNQESFKNKIPSENKKLRRACPDLSGGSIIPIKYLKYYMLHL